MSYDYSENILVQESAGHLLEDELGWEVKFAFDTEVLGENGTFGRKSYEEILLARYFREALKRLNPWLTPGQIDEAHCKLETHLSTASLLQINEEKYSMIRDGIPVTVKKPGGKTEKKKAAVIDFQHADNNHFLAIKELKIHGDLYRRRTDIVGFVNGLPLLFVELKKNTVDVQDAYTNNYTDYQDTIPHLFYYNAFLMLSNGTEAKVGTLGSKYEFFHEWKRLNEQEQGSVALETMLRGICKKENFLDLFENFILYDHSGGHAAKILARNHQYLGVNEAVKAYEACKLNNGELGVFCHTQGSGKSYSIIFLAQKIRRKFAGSPTIVVLTDRDELKKKRKHIDTVDLMVQINGIMGEYILIETQPSGQAPSRRFDISKIDFDLLRREFAKAKKKNLVIKDIAELDHWTDKLEMKAVVDNLIRDTLWAELPESYDDHAINLYRMQIYEYVYTRYRVAA